MNSKKTKKPLRRAKRWGARIWPMAGRLAAILAAVTVMVFSEMGEMVRAPSTTERRSRTAASAAPKVCWCPATY